MVTANMVMGVMKMAIIVPRVRIKFTSLAFWVNVLIIPPHRLPDITIIPTPTCLCSFLPEGSGQPTTLVYIYTLMCIDLTR